MSKLDEFYEKYNCEKCDCYGTGKCPFEDTMRCTRGASEDDE